MYTRRATLFVVGAGVIGLPGCTSNGTIVEKTGMALRDSVRFELDEGDTVLIEIDVRERSMVYDEIAVQIETVEQGAIEQWSFPESEGEWSTEFTAPHSAEYTLRMAGFGVADLVVSEVE